MKDLNEKLFFHGMKYKGDAAFINGYNGYESTEFDGLLCAVIENSCFDKNVPNYLLNENDEVIISKYNRGQKIIIN